MLQAHARPRDLHQFARAVVFAVTIGNLDMHANNIALLHPSNGSARLAPTYDAVPQAHRAGGRLALAIDGEYRHAVITRRYLETELFSWSMRRASAAVEEPLDDLTIALAEETPLDGAYDALYGLRGSGERDTGVEVIPACTGSRPADQQFHRVAIGVSLVAAS